MRIHELFETRQEDLTKLWWALGAGHNASSRIPSTRYIFDYAFGLTNFNEFKRIFLLAKRVGVDFNTDEVMKLILKLYRHLDDNYPLEHFRPQFNYFYTLLGPNPLPGYKAIHKSVNEKGR